MKAVVLSPHADDMELGVGGFVARLVSEGWDVYEILMQARNDYLFHAGQEVSAEERLAEKYCALKVLGIPKENLTVISMEGDLYAHDRS